MLYILIAEIMNPVLRNDRNLKILKDLGEKRWALSKLLKENWNDVPGSWKKAAEDCYFNMLGYISILAKRGKEGNKNHENARYRERKQAYAKLWKICMSVLWRTSWWRQAKCFNICRIGTDFFSSIQGEQRGTDRLFYNNDAIRAFQSILKFAVTLSSKTIFSSLTPCGDGKKDLNDSSVNNVDLIHATQDFHVGANKDPLYVPRTRPTIPILSGTVPWEISRTLRFLLSFITQNI